MATYVFSIFACLGGMLAIIFVAFFAFLNIFSGEILKGNYPKQLQLLVTLFSPPNDLYSYLAYQKLNLKTPSLNELTFTHKYPGRHYIGLISKEQDILDNIWHECLLDTKLHGELLYDGLLIGSMIEPKLSPFKGKDGYGYIIHTYSVSVSEIQQKNHKIVFSLKNDNPGKTCPTKHIEMYIFVQKLSDL
jgi:hypothetical protein